MNDDVQKDRVEITCGDRSATSAAAIQRVTAAQARRKALYGFFFCWAMAAFTAFIPLVHFVAVPTFIIASFVVARTIYKMFAGQADVIVAQPTCPSCNAALKLATTLSLFPLRERCPGCGKDISVRILP